MPMKDKYSKKHKWNAYDMSISELKRLNKYWLGEYWLRNRKFRICRKCGLIMYHSYGNNWLPLNEDEKTTCDKRRMFNALE